MDKLKLVEQSLIRDDLPAFKPGDTVNIHYRVREGDKERIQQFEGIVISIRGSGSNKTIIVRKISAGNIGVERVFPLNSPFIAKIEVKKEGDVRRAKLYYLRDLQGKAARIKEKDRLMAQQQAVEAAAPAGDEEETPVSDEAAPEEPEEAKKASSEEE